MKYAHHILIEIILVFLLAVLFIQYRQMKAERNALQASKKGLDFELKLRSDSMQESDKALAHLNHLSDSLFNEDDIRYFREKGLDSPKRDLLNDLYSRHDLIGEDAVLGGNMKIWHAVLLGRHWALAWYEDGHIAGNMLLNYQVNGGTIQWEVIDNVVNGQ